MACTNCATGGGCSTTGGSGGCGKSGGCSSGGCNKMNVFDWLSDMKIPLTEQYNIVEIRFKNGRKEFFRNNQYIELHTGDMVVVEAVSGYNIGTVSLQGDLVRLQMKKRGIKEESEEVRQILRLATEKDIEKHKQTQERNMPAMFRTRQIIQEMKLQMKLSDVEFQSDNTKATFYYSADDRVDFRELIKVLASEFKIRVEMKQISLRQEAGRLGGLGTCGRELCCSTWLNEYKSVGTSAARYQNLSLNPTKLSGQCGRLKCCLNYELETYIDALREIPILDENFLITKRGKAIWQKTDIFRKIMWFGYENETVWHPVKVERVLEIRKLNSQKFIPESLEMNDPLPRPVDMDEEDEEEVNPKNKGQRAKNQPNNKPNPPKGQAKNTPKIVPNPNQPRAKENPSNSGLKPPPLRPKSNNTPSPPPINKKPNITPNPRNQANKNPKKK